MAVRAKCYVGQKTDNSVTLHPVVDGSEENKNFWKYTPFGTIELGIDNPKALKQFEVGKEFYVDFTVCE